MEKSAGFITDVAKLLPSKKDTFVQCSCCTFKIQNP
jgi:hypothetical protein